MVIIWQKINKIRLIWIKLWLIIKRHKWNSCYFENMVIK